MILTSDIYFKKSRRRSTFPAPRRGNFPRGNFAISVAGFLPLGRQDRPAGLSTPKRRPGVKRKRELEDRINADYKGPEREGDTGPLGFTSVKESDAASRLKGVDRCRSTVNEHNATSHPSPPDTGESGGYFAHAAERPPSLRPHTRIRRVAKAPVHLTKDTPGPSPPSSLGPSLGSPRWSFDASILIFGQFFQIKKPYTHLLATFALP